MASERGRPVSPIHSRRSLFFRFDQPRLRTSWSQIVSQNKLDHSQLAHGLETIERNARIQAQLIEDLLDVSRIISGKLEMKTDPVDLSSVIAAAEDSLHPGPCNSPSRRF
jgi:signal transduction histidine kinase